MSAITLAWQSMLKNFILLGKVFIRDDGTCQIGQLCTCNKDGIATPATDDSKHVYHVLSRSAPNVIRIFLK